MPASTSRALPETGSAAPHAAPAAPGQRQTRQRRAVMRAMAEVGPHATAEQIIARVQESDPVIARSTVYRALDLLCQSGAAVAYRLHGRALRYELAGDEHQHALCHVCGSVLHIDDHAVRALESHLVQVQRFRPVRTEVAITGVCGKCVVESPAGVRVVDHA
ncbi:MAG: Fur family transcriptional regulator [Candidatus Dormibacteria bacterium]